MCLQGHSFATSSAQERVDLQHFRSCFLGKCLIVNKKDLHKVNVIGLHYPNSNNNHTRSSFKLKCKLDSRVEVCEHHN